MHIFVARIFKHRQTDKCNKAIKRRLRRQNVEMFERCEEMEFSLYVEEGGELVEGVKKFKYMGKPLDKTDDDWLEVWRNIRLETLLKQKEADPKVS